MSIVSAVASEPELSTYVAGTFLSGRYFAMRCWRSWHEQHPDGKAHYYDDSSAGGSAFMGFFGGLFWPLVWPIWGGVKVYDAYTDEANSIGKVIGTVFRYVFMSRLPRKERIAAKNRRLQEEKKALLERNEQLERELGLV